MYVAIVVYGTIMLVVVYFTNYDQVQSFTEIFTYSAHARYQQANLIRGFGSGTKHV